jgi:hypothetical protein
MSTVRRGDIVRALSDRVNARVGGRGIPREAVAEAVERDVDALEGRGDGAATEGNVGLVAVAPSDRMPDLASRLRRDLQAEGVVISEMGKASSGRHTVVTLRLPSGAKSALEQLAARLQVSDFICLAEAGSR